MKPTKTTKKKNTNTAHTDDCGTRAYGDWEPVVTVQSHGPANHDLTNGSRSRAGEQHLVRQEQIHELDEMRGHLNS